MDLQFEEVVVHNPALGATAQWSFTRAYFDSRNQVVGPTLLEEMLVLPVVLHPPSAKALFRMKKSSGLSKALLDAPEIPVGLQRRLEGFANLSLSSLGVSLASGLMSLDPDTPWPRYQPVPKSLPRRLKPTDEALKAIVGAAKRLGWWISQEEFATTCSLLRIRF